MLGRFIEKHQQFLDPNGGKTTMMPRNMKMSFILLSDCLVVAMNDNWTLIHELTPGPLHLMILVRHLILLISF